MAETVPRARLHAKSTQVLIEQYDAAVSSQRGRYSDTAPRQRRIDLIVDLLAARADNGDMQALAWLDGANGELVAYEVVNRADRSQVERVDLPDGDPNGVVRAGLLRQMNVTEWFVRDVYAR